MSDEEISTIMNESVLTQPYDFYDKIRNSSPVHFDPGLNAWLITRYDDVQQAARMTDELSNELGFGLVLRPEWQDEIDDMMWKEGFGPHIVTNTVQVDPPLHARRRSLINGAFSAHAVSALGDHIQSVARDAIDAFIDRGEADLLADYAKPIPIMTICDLLNFPRTKIDEMSEWADSSVAQIAMGSTKEEAIKHARNVMELQRFVMAAIESRRQNPGDDLISTLVHAEIDDPDNPRLTEEELMPMCLVLVAGGVDTTRNGIAWGAFNLAKNAALFQRIKQAEDQDKLLRGFVEETLRFETVVPQLPRFAKTDCEV
ncbi:MAG: cytochrome P450, partial [Pseudomonadota bacterium]